MTEREALKRALEALENNKQKHHYCEDTWYSCPKHEDGCANEAQGDECNCGADEINAQFDKAITAIKEALAQTEQELDYKAIGQQAYESGYSTGYMDCAVKMKAQPEQEPVAWRGYNWGHSPDDWVYRDFDDPILDGNGNNVGQPLYTTPPQRTWVGLTDEDWNSLRYDTEFFAGAEWAEAKLKEKNT